MTALPPGFFERPFAHRALHDAVRPENSLSAAGAAVGKGYSIEIDIQPSADGVAMVFHDETLDRMTGLRGRVRDLSAAELGEIPLGQSPDRIPTLTEVLDAIAGRVPLVVEIKDQSGRLEPTDGELETGVARALAGYAGPLAVMSFNPHMVARMRDLAPDIPRGLTTSKFSRLGLPRARRESLAAMEMLDETGSVFISHDARDLTSPHVTRVKARGLPVLCWTIRSQAEADRALRIADQITFEGFTPA